MWCPPKKKKKKKKTYPTKFVNKNNNNTTLVQSVLRWNLEAYPPSNNQFVVQMVKNMHMLGVAKGHKSLLIFVEKEGCPHKNYSFSIVKDNDKAKI